MNDCEFSIQYNEFLKKQINIMAEKYFYLYENDILDDHESGRIEGKLQGLKLAQKHFIGLHKINEVN